MITPDQLRKAALSLPKAIETPHFDRASFRIDTPKGKIFCTTPQEGETVNIFLSIDQQAMLIAAEPAIFEKHQTSGATRAQLSSI